MRNSSLFINNSKPKYEQQPVEDNHRPHMSLPKLVKMEGKLKDKDKIKN